MQNQSPISAPYSSNSEIRQLRSSSHNPIRSTAFSPWETEYKTQQPERASRYEHISPVFQANTQEPNIRQRNLYSKPGSIHGTPHSNRVPIFKQSIEAYGFNGPSHQTPTSITSRVTYRPGNGSVRDVGNLRRSKLPERLVNSRRIEGEPVVVSERRLPGYDVGYTDRPSYVTGVNRGQPRVIDEILVGEQNVRITENPMNERIRRPSLTQRRIGKEVIQVVERPVITERYVDKPFEMIIEKPVPNYLEVEVPYDVIVERPIEKIIEKDVVVDRIVEVQVEKHVEVPYERIVEVPTEKVIEIPVTIEEVVEIPVERVVEEYVETLVENPVYHDQIQEVDFQDLDQYQADEILPVETRYVDEEVRNLIFNLF